ncbi:hypothetical protein EH223_16060 [candidate division KSB1 bacterium]|nr:tetratricopeptide repeat protein [candidate division KSB1 bacterium]RQW01209.1 MAG: hypothetical protein EH223_16060 [candidate division KSB1 bacterium]
MSKKSYRSVLLALTIMLLGLFMLCAHKQTIVTPGEDLTSGDDEFREELLEMLDLANGGQETTMFAATSEPESASSEPGSPEPVMEAEVSDENDLSADEEELLALLAGLEEEAAAEVTIDETDAPTSEIVQSQDQVEEEDAPAPVSAGYLAYNELMSEVERLEMILEQRSEQVDSLHRIIDNRNARIMELENNIVDATSFASYSAEPEPVVVSTKTAKTYEPTLVHSGPYADKYNEGRRQFELYNYDSCIETMMSLLEQDPNHPLADNAQYWIGESYYGLKQYQKAILEFQKVFAFEKRDKYDDSQLMIGLSYVRLGQSEMARSTFGEFLDTYTGSEYTGVAKRYYYNI